MAALQAMAVATYTTAPERDTMPTLFEQLRERFSAQQEALRSLQQQVADAGGEASPEQESQMADLASEMERLSPRLEGQANVERTISATAQLLARAPQPVQRPGENGQPEPLALYRDAGHYLTDYLSARQGDRSAVDRLAVYMRAANQTTVDNPGIVPDPIVGTVLQWIDARRPLVDALGIRPLPAYPTFHRPHITQHTQVGVQSAEKLELASRKMTIARLTITAQTYGGYVDLSLQDRDFTNPEIMGILVQDLASQYALATELTASQMLDVQTTQTTTASLPATGATAAQVSAAIYEAAGIVYGASKQLPNVVFASVDMWPLVGSLFPSVNPTNAAGTGFSASSFEGGVVNGLRLVVAPNLPVKTIIVGSTDGMEAYEQRVGTLQALEVSLLGMQVGYAGFFACYVIKPEAFAQVTVAAAAGTRAS